MPTTIEKQHHLDDIKTRATELVSAECELGRKLVWGEGSVDAAAAIVGEAPGGTEDKLGKPFVGAAGQLLDRELARVGLSRSDFWITNIVKCRPTKLVGSSISNRPPTTKEIKAWSKVLMDELKTLEPRVVVCAGALAAKALIDTDFAITKDRGKWFDGPFGSMAIAIFHPAYIIRQMAIPGNRTIVEFRADLQKIRDALDEIEERSNGL